MTSRAAPADRPTDPPVEQTHPCVRCGAPVALDTAMCERCNPLGLSEPSASQVHGTVALGIVIAVVVLAVAGRLALSGVGPFEARILQILPVSGGLEVTLAVRNDGTSPGATRCRLSDPTTGGTGAGAFVTSPRIDAGAEATFTATIRQFGERPIPLAAVCRAP